MIYLVRNTSSIVVLIHVHHRLQPFVLLLRRFLLRGKLVSREEEIEEVVDVGSDDEPSSSFGDGSGPFGSCRVDVDEVLKEVELGPSRDLKQQRERKESQSR